MNEPIPVSTMIFTLNEEVHLPSCLASLRWCNDVIVVDSYSTDQTEAICQQAGVRFFQHPFAGFGSQRNWALDHIETDYSWILVLDADERVPPELAQELGQIARTDPTDTGAFRIRRRFYMWGRWLRYSSLYPTWVVRFIHKERIRYINRGHAETQQVEGIIGELQNDLIDENLKGIDEWFERQNRYSRKESEYELEYEQDGRRFLDVFSLDPLKRRAALKKLAWRAPARPLLYFLYSYVWKRGFLDGYDGFIFSYMKAIYQAMIQVKKYDTAKVSKR